MAFSRVDRIMRQGVAHGVFPGAVLLVAVKGEILFHEPYGVADLSDERPVNPDTVFDLASLTKPLATTLAVMKLVESGKLNLDQTVGSVLAGFENMDKSGITVRHLLDHTSGLPDYRPYYIELSRLPPEQRRTVLTELLAGEAPVHPAGEKTLYSDLGFMVLARMVETVGGDRLDRLVYRDIYDPLGLDNLFFVDLNAPRTKKGFAATERCPWRKKLLCGEVHDDNAWAMGGIDGHAGLFGTAPDLHRLLWVLQSACNGSAARRLFPENLVKLFLMRAPGRERALGFDTPVATGSGSGRHFSVNSVGHLGFTGTSFWTDLDRGISVILLTNRVHPSRENTGIRDFRPRLHNAVMESSVIRQE